MMELSWFAAFCCVVFVQRVSAIELTFELPDNKRECFYEEVDKGVEVVLEYQVVVGGNYDVDCEVFGPNNQVLYREQRKQYDSHSWTTQQKGTYKFCFSNEFSTFTHKLVYFDFQVGGEEPLIPEDGNENAPHTAMTLMESSAAAVHESLNLVLDYQTHARLREASGRLFAEELNARVQWWSIGVALLVVLVGIGQVLVLRSFFTDKRSANHYR